MELYKGSGEEKFKDFLKIGKLIVESHLCSAIEVEIQVELLKFVEILIDDFKRERNGDDSDESKEIEEIFYQITVKVTAISIYDENNKEITDHGRRCLSKLSENPENLHIKYLKPLINAIDGLDCENSERCEPIFFLFGYITLCNFRSEYLEEMKSAIKTVLDHARPEAKIKILAGVSMAMLNWKETIGVDSCDESVILLKDFINEIIIPCVIWHAGLSSETIRTMATSVLCSISQNATDEANKILPELSTHFTALIEDNNVTTRVYALRILFNCGPIGVEHIKAIGFGILSRLDDSYSQARFWAAKCLGKLTIKMDECGSDEWSNCLTHILSVLTLHLDDPDIQLTEEISQSIIHLGKRNLEIFKKFYEDSGKKSGCSKLDKLNEEILLSS